VDIGLVLGTMILLVCRRAQFGNLPRFLRRAPDLTRRVRLLAYQELLRWRMAPIGNYIFTASGSALREPQIAVLVERLRARLVRSRDAGVAR